MSDQLYTVEVSHPFEAPEPTLVKTSAEHPAIAGMQAVEEVFDSVTDLASDDEDYDSELSLFTDNAIVRVWEGHHDEPPSAAPVYETAEG